MYLELPKNFEYNIGDRRKAYVKKDVLYITADQIWEKVAYNLTYAIKGKKICSYCGKDITYNSVTMDHMYPRAQGGVSIPNNLYPVCTECNNRKGDLNLAQYKIWLDLNEKERKEYRKEVAEENEIIRQKIGFKLKKNWVTMESITKVNPVVWKHYTSKDLKYMKDRKFLNLYNNAPRPVVIDCNNRILSGEHLYFAERDLGIKRIPIIKLKNVKLLL